MQIGPVVVEPELVLAPMAGITDHPFRLLVKEQGCGLVFSEMISAKGLVYGGKAYRNLLFFVEEERPIAFQIFGSDPAVMAQAARILQEWGADLIDLNLGCPAPKILRNGEGGALLKDPARCASLIRSVVEAVEIPVTVKIRKGYDEYNQNAVEIALLAQESGAKAVTVHGRTVKQGFQGKADWDIIKEVSSALEIPVIGNGDVTTAQEAFQLQDYSRCAAVMIGRAARGNPWIFKQARAWMKEKRLLPEPSLEERKAMALRHLQLQVEFKGEKTAVLEMRKHMSWYFKSFPGAAAARERLRRAEKASEMAALVQSIEPNHF